MEQDVELEFIVGAERGLEELVREDEVMPLLRSAVSAGAGFAGIYEEGGALLWGYPQGAEAVAGGVTHPEASVSLPLRLEGEPVGSLQLRGPETAGERLSSAATVVEAAISSMLRVNLKRMMTTELHTKVVNQSYEELLRSNRRLAASEKRYRQLSRDLERQVAERTEELKRIYVRLVQQEKLASVGQLAAGMAHEINNPLGFVLSNLKTLTRYMEQLAMMIDLFSDVVGQDQVPGELKRMVGEGWRRLRIDFLLKDVPALLDQSIAGAERVKKVVADLKGFSHVDGAGEGRCDVNRELARTLAVLAPQFPPGTRVMKNLGRLPEVEANPALLCQVFYNVLRNALQARGEGLNLAIHSACSGQKVQIAIRDNGPGIPEKIRERVFEPFFTTRTVGQGMGMGLTVARNIVQALSGSIELQSRDGRGVTVLIKLPLSRKATCPSTPNSSAP